MAKANAEDFAIRTGGGGGGGGGGINVLESTTTPAASVVNGDASEVGGCASNVIVNSFRHRYRFDQGR